MGAPLPSAAAAADVVRRERSSPMPMLLLLLLLLQRRRQHHRKTVSSSGIGFPWTRKGLVRLSVLRRRPQQQHRRLRQQARRHRHQLRRLCWKTGQQQGPSYRIVNSPQNWHLQVCTVPAVVLELVVGPFFDRVIMRRRMLLRHLLPVGSRRGCLLRLLPYAAAATMTILTTTANILDRRISGRSELRLRRWRRHGRDSPERAPLAAEGSRTVIEQPPPPCTSCAPLARTWPVKRASRRSMSARRRACRSRSRGTDKPTGKRWRTCRYLNRTRSC